MICTSMQWIPAINEMEPAEFGLALQNLAITFEMAIFAVIYIFAYPVTPYKIKAASQVLLSLAQAPLARDYELGGSIKGSVVHSVKQTDLVRDTVEVFCPCFLPLCFTKYVVEQTLEKKKEDLDFDTKDRTKHEVDEGGSESSSEGKGKLVQKRNKFDLSKKGQQAMIEERIEQQLKKERENGRDIELKASDRKNGSSDSDSDHRLDDLPDDI